METYSSSLENGSRVANSIERNVFYGAGVAKLAAIIGCNSSKAKKILNDFWNGNPGVRDLKESLEEQYRHYGFIVGLDGRKIHIRQDYKLLNSLIQSAAGIVWKKWGVLANQRLRETCLDCHQVIAYHDEYEYDCAELEVPLASQIIGTAAVDAGNYFGLKVPVTADIKVGKNWAEVH